MKGAIFASLNDCALDVFAMATQTETAADECSALLVIDTTQQFYTMTTGKQSAITPKFCLLCLQYSRIARLNPTSKLPAQYNFKTRIKELARLVNHNQLQRPQRQTK